MENCFTLSLWRFKECSPVSKDFVKGGGPGSYDDYKCWTKRCARGVERPLLASHLLTINLFYPIYNLYLFTSLQEIVYFLPSLNSIIFPSLPPHKTETYYSLDPLSDTLQRREITSKIMVQILVILSFFLRSTRRETQKSQECILWQ